MKTKVEKWVEEFECGPVYMGGIKIVGFIAAVGLVLFFYFLLTIGIPE